MGNYRDCLVGNKRVRKRYTFSLLNIGRLEPIEEGLVKHMGSENATDTVARFSYENATFLQLLEHCIESLVSGRKIQAIKAWRTITEDGLKESKHAIDCIIDGTGVLESWDRVRRAKQELEEAEHDLATRSGYASDRVRNQLADFETLDRVRVNELKQKIEGLMYSEITPEPLILSMHQIQKINDLVDSFRE